MRPIATGILASLVALIATPAAAHIGLIYPPSRYGEDVLKIAPCGLGNGTRSGNVTVLESGATIRVQWDEYIDHPGHFRISFDADGDDDFADPPCFSGCNSRTPDIGRYSNSAVLLDGIPDTPSGGDSEVAVTLPDIECERCTLQVIQVMYDKPPYTTPGGNDIYYQCADLALRRSATATPSATAQPSLTPTPEPSPSPSPIAPTATASPVVVCAGDCDNTGAVEVNDLVTMVTIALGDSPTSICGTGDIDGDGVIQVNELVAAIGNAMLGCSR